MLGLTWMLGGFLVLVLVESAYRFQMLDTYATELGAFNTPEDLAAKPGGTLLVLGDSLTAGRGSYPDLVRRVRPDLRVVNGGLPGTGIVQAGLVAPGRFREFAPTLFVYQLNVGNDLLNLRWPIAWGKRSAARNAYWTLSERFRSLEFLNYRLGQLAFRMRWRHLERPPGPSEVVHAPAACRWEHGPVSADGFAGMRRYLEATPYFVENHVMVRDEAGEAYEELLDRLPALLAHCEPPACRAWLLIVPDPAQIAPGYVDRARQLGARFRAEDALARADYPFIAGIAELLEQVGRDDVGLIDPLPALRRAEATGTRVCYRQDAHLNGCGQTILAEAVTAALPKGSSLRRTFRERNVPRRLDP